MKVLHYRTILFATANRGGAQYHVRLVNNVEYNGVWVYDTERYYIWLHHGEIHNGNNKSSITLSETLEWKYNIIFLLRFLKKVYKKWTKKYKCKYSYKHINLWTTAIFQITK